MGKQSIRTLNSFRCKNKTKHLNNYGYKIKRKCHKPQRYINKKLKAKGRKKMESNISNLFPHF